jgi:hypothetical protein
MYWQSCRSFKCCGVTKDPFHTEDGKVLSWCSFCGMHGALCNILSRSVFFLMVDAFFA